MSLLGHLNFASRVIRQGRSFVSYLLALAASVKELHHYVKPNGECRLDMEMWLRFLSEWNGVALFLSRVMQASGLSGHVAQSRDSDQ